MSDWLHLLKQICDRLVYYQAIATTVYFLCISQIIFKGDRS
ncbi:MULTISPECIES: hypothetical protein [unclassified Anabaena]